jgi:hypothetical protein
MDIKPKFAMPLFQNSLNTHVVYHDLLSQIILELSKIPCVDNLKLDLEVTLHAMKVIEVLCSNDPSSTSTDKKNLLLNSLKAIIPDINDTDITIVSNGIDFIHKANLIVIEKTTKSLLQWAITPLRSIYKKLKSKN